MDKLCPIRRKTFVIQNRLGNSQTISIGINNCVDNDISYTEFLPCLEEKCMMFNQVTKTCEYLKFQEG